MSKETKAMPVSEKEYATLTAAHKAFPDLEAVFQRLSYELSKDGYDRVYADGYYEALIEKRGSQND